MQYVEHLYTAFRFSPCPVHSLSFERPLSSLARHLMCYEANRNTVNCRFPYDPQEDYFPPECGGHSSIEDRVHGTELNGHGLVYLGDLTEERLREHDDTEGFTPMLSYSLSNMVTEGQE